MVRLTAMGPRYEELKLHTCNKQDKLTFNSFEYVTSYFELLFDTGQLLCLDDPSKLNLKGKVFGQELSETLRISIKRCVDKPTCKSEQEINERVESLTMISLWNTQSYNPNSYDEKTIQSSIYAKREQFDTKVKSYLSILEVQKGSVDSQQSRMDFGFSENQNLNLYSFIEKSTEKYYTASVPGLIGGY